MSLPQFIVKKNILIPFLKQEKEKYQKKNYRENNCQIHSDQKKISNEKTAF